MSTNLDGTYTNGQYVNVTASYVLTSPSGTTTIQLYWPMSNFVGKITMSTFSANGDIGMTAYNIFSASSNNSSYPVLIQANTQNTTAAPNANGAINYAEADNYGYYYGLQYIVCAKNDTITFVINYEGIIEANSQITNLTTTSPNPPPT